MPAKTDYDTAADVVVIGSGLSGMVSALTAQEAGAKVTVIEKLDIIGGSSGLSEGSIAGSTNADDNARILPNLEVVSEFLPTKYALNTDKITSTANALAEAHTWLYTALSEGGMAEEGECVLVPYTANFYVGENVDKSVNTDDDRWNLIATGIFPMKANSYHGADYMIKLLAKRFTDNGGTIYTATTATKLITNGDGAVTGVEAETDGGTVTFDAGAVVLACGGSGRNTDNLIERDRGDETYACIGATGDALTLGQGAGAAVYEDQRILTNSGRIYPINLFNGVAYSQTPFTSMYVDDSGNRRCAEDIWMTLIHACFFTEGRDHYWSVANAAVLDSEVLKYGSADIAGMNMLELVESRLEDYPDYYVKADTIEELGEKLNMPNLAGTLAAYNAGCESGEDEFGKTAPYMISMDEGPYYAIYATLYGPGTQGGVVSDGECRVLDTNGSAIAGLYVAGEASNGGFFTEAYMCTHMLGICLGTGRIAGANAAACAVK